MAKQNKGRKFFAASATAALVASAIVPVASAAQVNDYNKISGYAKEAVQSLVDQGVIQGDTNGNFNPLNTVTRAQAAEIFTKALELEADGDVNFSDVKKGAWYYNSIAAVVANGIFEGVSANEFAPNKSLTRSEAAKVLVDAFGLEGSESLSQFADASQVKGWAKSALETAVANGIFTGSEENGKLNLKPNAAITRQDFAVVFARTLDLAVETVDASVKAINNTTVEVTFDEEVDNVEALKFKIEGLEVKNAAVKQTNKKVVVLTTASQTADKEYVVTLDGEEIGKFKGIEAVVPKSIVLKTTNTQGKVGNQVTLTADVGVKAEGIPVTFNIDAPTGSLNKDAVVEVYTNAEGIASYSYTQYSPEADDVTVYPTGAPQLRAFGTVYWGVDNILTIEEVTTGNTLANGVKKTYKVTFKDPKTGAALANRNLNVSFVENTNVDFNAISKATVTNPATGLTVTPYQTTTGLVEGIKVTTDFNGQATFVVSGTNTSVTPYVFVDGSSSVWYSQNNVTGTQQVQSNTNINNKWEATELTTTAPQVKFEGAQLNNQITVERAGDEEAAAYFTENGEVKYNGREYKIKVVDKEGKAYNGGIVNVALDEVIDKNLTTNTTAQLRNVSDSNAVTLRAGSNGQQATVKLNAKGEASFLLYGADDVSATPVVWIDQNVAENYQSGVLEDGEPFFKAPVSNFQFERVIAGKLILEGKATNQTVTDGVANYSFAALNQSGVELNRLAGKMTYEIRNTGSQDVYVTLPNATYVTQGNVAVTANHRIAVGGSLTVSADVASKLQTALNITGTSTVVVTPTFVTTSNFDASTDNGTVTDARDFNKYLTAGALTATIGNAADIGTEYTGYLATYNTTSKELTFAGKNPVKYAGESGKTYEYYGTNGAPIIGDANFMNALVTAADSTPGTPGNESAVRATYRVVDNVVKIYLLDAVVSTTPTVPAGTVASGQIETAELNAAGTQLTVTFNKNINPASIQAADFTTGGAAFGTVASASGNKVVLNVTAVGTPAVTDTINVAQDAITFADGITNITAISKVVTQATVVPGVKVTALSTTTPSSILGAGTQTAGSVAVGSNTVKAQVAVARAPFYASYNGVKVKFEQEATLNVTSAAYNAATNEVTVKIPALPAGTTLTVAQINAALAATTGPVNGNVLATAIELAADSYVPTFAELTAPVTVSLAGGVNTTATVPGVYTFTLNVIPQVGDSISINGFTYVAGTDFTVESNIATTTANLVTAIKGKDIRFANAGTTNALGVVTLTETTATGHAAPSFSFSFR